MAKRKKTKSEERREKIKFIRRVNLIRVPGSEEELKGFKPETLLKFDQIYSDYKQLRLNVQSLYPEISSYINLQFYYNILGKEHNLSPNYICTIINRLEANKQYLELCVERAKILVAHRKMDE